MAHIDRWSPKPFRKAPDARSWRTMPVEIESAPMLTLAPEPHKTRPAPVQDKRREAPHVPLQSDTSVPKEDPIWAKMYRVLMFDIQLFAEHHHEPFRSGPTSGRRSR